MASKELMDKVHRVVGGMMDQQTAANIADETIKYVLDDVIGPDEIEVAFESESAVRNAVKRDLRTKLRKLIE